MATLASLQQQQQLLAQAQAQAAQQQQQQQQQQAATAQKLANAPVRKDNTWIQELEKQSRPTQMGRAGQQQQQPRLLNTIGKKVIGEELAAQQLISPGQQTQAGHAAAAATAEPIKRKSGELKGVR